MSLTYIAQQCTIYGGFFLLITGTVGNFLTILTFSSVRIYRTTPSTFYFIIGSIHNIVYILINLIVRLINAITGFELNTSSKAWCMMLTFLIGYLGLTSFTCSCLATIDQFFVTSRNAHVRRCSNIKWAHRIVFIVMIIWCLHGIPDFLYYNIPPVTTSCESTNPHYLTYIPIYILGLQCGIPVLIMLVFGSLAYRNIHQTRALARQQADRQITKMVLMQIILVVISMTPFGIMTAYSLITAGVSKSIDQQIKEYFVTIILVLVTYLYYVVCLLFKYIFMKSFFCRAISTYFLFHQVVFVSQLKSGYAAG